VAEADDIVNEAGISKGLLYWHFKTKDAVLAARIVPVTFQAAITLGAVLEGVLLLWPFDLRGVDPDIPRLRGGRRRFAWDLVRIKPRRCRRQLTFELWDRTV
jgi:AcrR family transcriptional regulator